jgi:hypothetical protein
VNAPTEQEAPSSDDPWIRRAVLTGGGLLVLGLGAFVIYVMISGSVLLDQGLPLDPALEQSADLKSIPGRHVGHVRKGRMEEVFSDCTPELRASWLGEGFAEHAVRFPALYAADLIRVARAKVEGDEATLTVRFQGGGGEGKVEFRLEREEGRWWLASIDVPAPRRL